MKKQKCQTEMMWLHKVTLSVPASPPTTPASATSETGRTDPPLPPPPTQQKDITDEDLYGDPLPLNEQ